MAESGSTKKITIHTDGGCDGNPGPGGWAALLRFGDHLRELTGGGPATTNNRMELQAAISALTALKEPCDVTLFTDSEYLRQGITEWLQVWNANHWRTADHEPVKNEDLWRQLDEAASRHSVTWQWLKGHVGHPNNERCDQLEGAEIVKLRRNYSPVKLAALREAFVARAGIQTESKATCFERSWAIACTVSPQLVTCRKKMFWYVGLVLRCRTCVRRAG